MTVKELIKKLGEFPEETRVMICVGESDMVSPIDSVDLLDGFRLEDEHAGEKFVQLWTE